MLTTKDLKDVMGLILKDLNKMKPTEHVGRRAGKPTHFDTLTVYQQAQRTLGQEELDKRITLGNKQRDNAAKRAKARKHTFEGIIGCTLEEWASRIQSREGFGFSVTNPAFLTARSHNCFTVLAGDTVQAEKLYDGASYIQNIVDYVNPDGPAPTGHKNCATMQRDYADSAMMFTFDDENVAARITARTARKQRRLELQKELAKLGLVFTEFRLDHVDAPSAFYLGLPEPKHDARDAAMYVGWVHFVCRGEPTDPETLAAVTTWNDEHTDTDPSAKFMPGNEGLTNNTWRFCYGPGMTYTRDRKTNLDHQVIAGTWNMVNVTNMPFLKHTILAPYDDGSDKDAMTTTPKAAVVA